MYNSMDKNARPVEVYLEIDDNTCGICLGVISDDDQSTFPICEHRFCTSCLRTNKSYDCVTGQCCLCINMANMIAVSKGEPINESELCTNVSPIYIPLQFWFNKNPDLAFPCFSTPESSRYVSGDELLAPKLY